MDFHNGLVARQEHGALQRPIRSGADYIESLRGRNLRLYVLGELVDEPVDHPLIRPSINAVAETYDLALQHPELASAVSPYTGERVNRFLHIAAEGLRNHVHGVANLLEALPHLLRHVVVIAH